MLRFARSYLAVLSLVLGAALPMIATDAAAQCGNWELRFTLDETSAPVGSVQIVLEHDPALGRFLRDGGRVDCRSDIEASIFSANGNADSGRLRIGMITLEGTAAGTPLARCLFSGDWSDEPAVADFELTVEEASGLDLKPVDVEVSFDVVALGVPEDCEEICGDGVATPPEECDDGNASNDDACVDGCIDAVCGDGFVEESVEDCEDANSVNTDACRNDCRAARCGDAVVHEGVEECDDGNLSNSDGCVEGCVAASCGDGFHLADVEECDDGDTADGDGCSASCTIERICGDATGDGSVLAGDALRVLQRAVGLPVVCPEEACDVNASGAITVMDALAVLRFSVELEASLDCPD